jgi:hypothetical protein
MNGAVRGERGREDWILTNVGVRTSESEGVYNCERERAGNGK